MQYMGSKTRISKRILPYIYDLSLNCDAYVEPFVGGCNMIDKLSRDIGIPCIGADANPYLIAMWEALQKGWVPPSEVSYDHWFSVKHCKEMYPPEEVAFIGFCCSFGARWFTSYAKNAKGDNYAARSMRVLLKQIKLLSDVNFVYTDYKTLVVPPNSLIYCDPPYKGTAKYMASFDHEEFYDKCLDWLLDGHTIIMSEYSAPEYFEVLLEIPHRSTLSRVSNSTERVEKLYVLHSF